MHLLPSPDGLQVLAFASRCELRSWLIAQHALSKGVWIQLAKTGALEKTVSFQEILEEGLCFGWSESKRRKGDGMYYLQRFTPRRAVGTTSERNVALAHKLVAEGRMTSSGLVALGWEQREA